MKHILVLGDIQTVQFFSLVGAWGCVVEKDDAGSLAVALDRIRSQEKEIGAVVVTASLAGTVLDRIERMQGITLPVIQLPDAQNPSQLQALENIMEKAIGMKLR